MVSLGLAFVCMYVCVCEINVCFVGVDREVKLVVEFFGEKTLGVKIEEVV